MKEYETVIKITLSWAQICYSRVHGPKEAMPALEREIGMCESNCPLPTSCVVPVIKSPQDYQAYRISPEDTNRLAIVFDPTVANISLTYCVEIFDVGGKTPPNRHQIAVEMFFVLKGQGRATCDGKTVPIQSGDSILVPPTGVHVIENTGSTRLYALCIMIPNEDFAELIRSGTPVELDEEDFAVLGRQDTTAANLVSWTY